MHDWEAFVLQHGWRANQHELAAVVGQPPAEITVLRATGAVTKRSKALGFIELFTMWHGRPPEDADWPVPRRSGARGSYEWQQRELALLVSLVGTLGTKEISKLLTTRLQLETNDPLAERSIASVLIRINKAGLTTSDLVGGITTAQAAQEAGSLAVIQSAIASGRLASRRVGQRLVIPHNAWLEWKAAHTTAPDGFVRLSTLREPLAIKSDKLSEFARMGFVPSAVRCNPFGVNGPSTQFGTWFVDPKIAEQLVEDRRAGRPMPWHGKPLAENLRVTYRLWTARRHPASCEICRDLWGKEGAPETFEAYCLQYPPLAHGAKRHLTRTFSRGLTIAMVAEKAACGVSRVRRAIKLGLLAATKEKGRTYVTRTDATRWIARKMPCGDSAKSWLTLESAAKQYLFTARELNRFMESGQLTHKVGTEGAMRGLHYVLRQQCAQLRQTLGFTAKQAAQRVGVTTARLRELLDGVHWRQSGLIPLATVQAVIKRLESHQGYTVEEAAAQLGRSVRWVEDRICDGTVKVKRTKWEPERRYLTQVMLDRLRSTPDRRDLVPPEAPPPGLWLGLGEAAMDAGVSAATLIKWAVANEVHRRQIAQGWRYDRHSLRQRAQKYWQHVRYHRATPPTWYASPRQLEPSQAA